MSKIFFSRRKYPQGGEFCVYRQGVRGVQVGLMVDSDFPDLRESEYSGAQIRGQKFGGREWGSWVESVAGGNGRLTCSERDGRMGAVPEKAFIGCRRRGNGARLDRQGWKIADGKCPTANSEGAKTVSSVDVGGARKMT
ncbi:hypothetical protein Zmor_004035 [Zophobas morio]|uniref:Uncharacterized protein n=1 Tax=Zophobas morio TaxID=2755281 RepID=A0AA38HJX2_9CUCU|nr:hypothetical protein Zmor_004035 [Zophobas morio]